MTFKGRAVVLFFIAHCEGAGAVLTTSTYNNNLKLLWVFYSNHTQSCCSESARAVLCNLHGRAQRGPLHPDTEPAGSPYKMQLDLWICFVSLARLHTAVCLLLAHKWYKITGQYYNLLFVNFIPFCHLLVYGGSDGLISPRNSCPTCNIPVTFHIEVV